MLVSRNMSCAQESEPQILGASRGRFDKLGFSSLVLRPDTLPLKDGETILANDPLTSQHPVLFASSSSALLLFPTAFSSTSVLSASNQCLLPLRSHHPAHLLRRLHPSR